MSIIYKKCNICVRVCVCYVCTPENICIATFCPIMYLMIVLSYILLIANIIHVQNANVHTQKFEVSLG